MTEVTVIGSGVIGLTIAYFLKLNEGNANPYDITIVAREIPKRQYEQGDDWVNGEWASPWAGAIFCYALDLDEEGKRMQMESYKHFWKIAHNDPSSGVDMRMCRQYYDETDVRNPRDCEKLWGKNFLAKYRYLSQDELPKQLRGITFGEEYLSMSINPWLYLPWIRTKLESMGVRFIQKQVNSIHNIKADIIINATGLGSEKLNGVNDQQVEAVRGQTMWVKSDYTGFMAIRHGIEYTYVIPRALSGGVIFGGVSDSSNFNVKPEYETKRDIMERVRDLIPEVVSNAQELKKLTNKNSSSDANAELVESVDIIRDIVAFRPGRKGEARVEVVKQSPVLVHAYGFEGSGYIYSGGVAWKVRQELDSLTGHQRNCSKL